MYVYMYTYIFIYIYERIYVSIYENEYIINERNYDIILTMKFSSIDSILV